ncbi:MAG: hypothetical protein LBP39_03475 [Rickettsiales bacterium]|jgi:hypothetical protein|nr:hypothetical protein [Rickettsiales bacterium]
MNKNKSPRKKLGILGYSCLAIVAMVLIHSGLTIYGRWNVGKLKVDIVYLWCDGNDLVFAEKRKTAAARIGRKEHKSNLRGRFSNNDELKFSLRSLEKYAPWINHIFIVTNKQVPPWLDTKNSKITIVDQGSIMPKKYNPHFSFSSPAIESYLHKIPNLSEHFLYANDDMFFGSRVKPWFFFDRKGNPIVRGFKISKFYKKKKKLREYIKKADKIYNQTIFYSLYLVMEKFGDVPDIFPHHNIDAYRKSYMEDTFSTFKKEYDYTSSYPFRKKNTLQRVIISYVDYAKKRATIRYVKSRHTLLLRKFHFLTQFQDSLYRPLSYFSSEKAKYAKKFEKEKKWLKNGKFPLFCLNDNSGSTEDDRLEAKKFLGELFPEKSSFEK